MPKRSSWQDGRKAQEQHMVQASSDSAGCMGTSAVENWLAGLWAWHTFHNFPFPGDTPTIQAAIVAVAFWAVICVAFWGIARLGEVMVPSVNRFILGRHVHKDTAVLWSTHGDAQSVSVHIPWTKTTQRTGATLILTHEDDCTCPFRAVQQQLLTNAALPSDAHFFGFLTSDGWQPMVKRSVITRCNEIWARYGLQGPSGHSFRIGGTTHHLTRGTDVKVVQQLGWWTSDAFYIYWCNMQAIIPLHVHNAARRADIIHKVDAFLLDASPEVKTRWEEIEKAREEMSSTLPPVRKKARTGKTHR
ncbi:hypothetical protein BS47DRAFT_1379045 [Hydnum rufescens UP504]|uniref:Tyr recombinase domain-containing protein n=1 Tax=Hydnum rufescens UP504 TaxID=1448309 RepID=A0A9P6B957_9AGAM|nr:hypothetical protein BS47DRAFT_1379045 [Hydnum rufescens UP504]